MMIRYRLSPALLLTTSLFLLLLACCGSVKAEKMERDLSPTTHQDLLMGYTLLENTLNDESKLWALKILKKLTFRATADEVSSTMDRISTSASQRKKELKALRKLLPDVTGTPIKMSSIGDAITSAAKEVGTDEMLDKTIAFNLRFMILQAQATRMVSAMAAAIAKYDTNDERQKWLEIVSAEYEGYRDDIVNEIRKYIRGQGSAQLNPTWWYSRARASARKKDE